MSSRKTAHLTSPQKIGLAEEGRFDQRLKCVFLSLHRRRCRSKSGSAALKAAQKMYVATDLEK